jgi:hypothetical protein
VRAQRAKRVSHGSADCACAARGQAPLANSRGERRKKVVGWIATVVERASIQATFARPLKQKKRVTGMAKGTASRIATDVQLIATLIAGIN